MRAYAAGALEREIEPLTREQRMTERVILGLRLAEGVNLVAFARDFGVELHDVYAAILPRYLDQGVLSVQDGSLRLTDAYAFVANTVLADFVIEEGE
jgi:oxygen-independent coproporphyrinogen-3 oxidase